MNRLLTTVTTTFLLLFGTGGVAQAEEVELDDVRDRLAETMPGLEFTSIAETPLENFFELVIDGQIYYVDQGGEYLLDGSLIELSSRTNLTEGRLGGIHSSLIEEMGEENMLIYEPEEPSDRSITVFTDISCGYCRKLHEDIDTLLTSGVRVRYLLFPRAGIGSQAHKDLESVWCSDNPQKAMTTAKQGGNVVAKSCDNPIEAHVALAEQIGLRGTPLIYLDNGERIPGFREPAIIAEMINTSEKMIN